MKLPEEDIENPGKGCHYRKETGARNRLGAGEGGKHLAPLDPPLQASFLAGPPLGALSRENREGEELEESGMWNRY